MNAKKSVKDVDVEGKRVILRVDFNVPLAEGTVTDDTRIRASVPTINYLIQHGAKVIILSHLGRPSGTGYEEKFSLAPVARVLSRIIGKPVTFVQDLVGPDAHAAADALQPGDVMMLENSRFDPRDTKGDPELAREIASLGELYVNDAFGAAHRDNASISGVAHYLPSVSGLLLQQELETLTSMLDEPTHPFVAILGGAKVGDKIKIINHLVEIVDTLIIGGGMCYTFLHAMGKGIGTSLFEPELEGEAEAAIAKAKERGVTLLLPVDVVVNDACSEEGDIHVVSVDEIPDGMMGLDIGPATRELYSRAIAEARTIFWNGPMGVFEMRAFEGGTKEVAQAVARNKRAVSVVGGGDSACALAQFGLEDEITFISTGGGASMALLEGRKLPGVECLMNA